METTSPPQSEALQTTLILEMWLKYNGVLFWGVGKRPSNAVAGITQPVEQLGLATFCCGK
jgi:hypothetical protein